MDCLKDLRTFILRTETAIAMQMTTNSVATQNATVMLSLGPLPLAGDVWTVFVSDPMIVVSNTRGAWVAWWRPTCGT